MIMRIEGFTNMKYDTFIFDLDGTLLNTIDDLTDSLNYALKKNNLNEYKVDEVKPSILIIIFRVCFTKKTSTCFHRVN